MFKKALFLALALCSFIGCASQKMGYGDAQTGLRLRYQLSAGDAAVYSIHSTTTDSMKLMGKLYTSTSEVNSQFSHRILSKLADDQTQVGISLDSVRFKSNNQDLSAILITFEDAIKSLLNKEMRTQVSNLGEIQIHSPIDSLIPTRLLPFINPKHAIYLSYPAFSNDPVKPGEMWETAFQFKRTAPALKAKIRCQTTSRLEKIVSGDSTQFAQISSSGNYEITGQGRQLNTIARTEGTGTIEGHYVFDFQRGRFLTGDFVEKIQLKYFFPGVESMPVTQTMHIKTSVSLK
jgi:hypothetical protein